MDYHRLLQPKRVVVIGVSTSKDNHPANFIFRKLQLRYPVAAFAINHQNGALLGELMIKI